MTKYLSFSFMLFGSMVALVACSREEFNPPVTVTTFDGTMCYEEFSFVVNPYLNPRDTVNASDTTFPCKVNRVEIKDSLGKWLHLTRVTPFSQEFDTLLPISSDSLFYEYTYSGPRDATSYSISLRFSGNETFITDCYRMFHWEPGTYQSYTTYIGEGILD